MSDKFTVEIITPNETILKTETNEVNIPSFEGQMGILKDQEKKYYVEEGTVEFSNNNLLILTSTARDLTKLNQDSIEELLKSAENKFSDNHSSDKEKYISSYKISTLKEINQ